MRSLALRVAGWVVGRAMDAVLGANDGPSEYVSPTTGERVW